MNNGRRVVIVGGVDGGASAATRARRLGEDAEIVLLERGGEVSFANCGMPYHIGGIVERAEELTPRDPTFFKSKYNVDILTRHEVLEGRHPPHEFPELFLNLVLGLLHR